MGAVGGAAFYKGKEKGLAKSVSNFKEALHDLRDEKDAKSNNQRPADSEEPEIAKGP